MYKDFLKVLSSWSEKKTTTRKRKSKAYFPAMKEKWWQIPNSNQIFSEGLEQNIRQNENDLIKAV